MTYWEHPIDDCCFDMGNCKYAEVDSLKKIAPLIASTKI